MDTYPIQVLRVFVIIICFIYIIGLLYWMIKIPLRRWSIFMARLHMTTWVLCIFPLYIIYLFHYESIVSLEVRVIWGHIIVLQILITSVGILLTKIRMSLKDSNVDLDNITKFIL